MQIRLASIFYFLFFFSSYLDENCFDTNLFTSPGCLVKQPTNCSRLSKRKEKKKRKKYIVCIGRLSTALVVLHFVFCFLFSSSSSFIVGLFCSGGMWTIAHPSSAEPSWRPSIRMRDQNQQSPIHFCLCRDIYHSDVIEISIHPVCVVSPLYRLCVFHFLFPKKKKNDHTGRESLEISVGTENFFGKEKCWQNNLETIPVFLYILLSLYIALRCFLFLLWTRWTAQHENVGLFSIRLNDVPILFPF